MKASKFTAEPTVGSGSTSTATLALIGKKSGFTSVVKYNKRRSWVVGLGRSIGLPHPCYALNT
jgi:hypothetical protein